MPLLHLAAERVHGVLRPCVPVVHLLEVHGYWLGGRDRVSRLGFLAELAESGRFQVDVLRLLYVGLQGALEEVLQSQGVVVGAALVERRVAVIAAFVVGAVVISPSSLGLL